MEHTVKTKRVPDPFAPVEAVVSIGLGLFLGGLLVFVGIATVQLMTDGDTTVSVGAIGSDHACALVPNEVVPHATDVPQGDLRRDVGRVHAEEVELCLSDPSLGQRAASALTPVGDLIFVIGGLLLVRRVIRAGRRGGLFTDVMATRTRQLGWFLLVMTVVWPFVAAAGAGVVVEAAVRRGQWTDLLGHPSGSLGLVVVSFGILTVARILRRAVALQEEVDATI